MASRHGHCSDGEEAVGDREADHHGWHADYESRELSAP
jgi:hypothetical protein